MCASWTVSSNSPERLGNAGTVGEARQSYFLERGAVRRTLPVVCYSRASRVKGCHCCSSSRRSWLPAPRSRAHLWLFGTATGRSGALKGRESGLRVSSRARWMERAGPANLVRQWAPLKLAIGSSGCLAALRVSVRRAISLFDPQRCTAYPTDPRAAHEQPPGVRHQLSEISLVRWYKRAERFAGPATGAIIVAEPPSWLLLPHPPNNRGMRLDRRLTFNVEW